MGFSWSLRVDSWARFRDLMSFWTVTQSIVFVIRVTERTKAWKRRHRAANQMASHYMLRMSEVPRCPSFRMTVHPWDWLSRTWPDHILWGALDPTVYRFWRLTLHGLRRVLASSTADNWFIKLRTVQHQPLNCSLDKSLFQYSAEFSGRFRLVRLV